MVCVVGNWDPAAIKIKTYTEGERPGSDGVDLTGESTINALSVAGVRGSIASSILLSSSIRDSKYKLL